MAGGQRKRAVGHASDKRRIAAGQPGSTRTEEPPGIVIDTFTLEALVASVGSRLGRARDAALERDIKRRQDDGGRTREIG